MSGQSRKLRELRPNRLDKVALSEGKNPDFRIVWIFYNYFPDGLSDALR